MKCTESHERLAAMKEGKLGELESHTLQAHLAECSDCRSAASASAALQKLRGMPGVAPPAELFERVMSRSMDQGEADRPTSRFWLGAGVGAAVAASIILAVVVVVREPVVPQPVADSPDTQIALGEPRDINLAIEMERDLPGALITVALNGGLELAGYAGRKQLSWQADLRAGVNKLTLPVMAVDESGGQLVVTVNHGNKERRFTLDLPTARSATTETG